MQHILNFITICSITLIGKYVIQINIFPTEWNVFKPEVDHKSSCIILIMQSLLSYLYRHSANTMHSDKLFCSGIFSLIWSSEFVTNKNSCIILMTSITIATRFLLHDRWDFLHKQSERCFSANEMFLKILSLLLIKHRIWNNTAKKRIFCFVLLLFPRNLLFVYV